MIDRDVIHNYNTNNCLEAILGWISLHEVHEQTHQALTPAQEIDWMQAL